MKGLHIMMLTLVLFCVGDAAWEMARVASGYHMNQSTTMTWLAIAIVWMTLTGSWVAIAARRQR